MDRRQNIFCIFNISDTPQEIHLSEVNLTEFSEWVDLISGNKIDDIGGLLIVQPYQYYWISSV